MTSSDFQGEYRSFSTFITWIPSNPILYVEFRLSYEPTLSLVFVQHWRVCVCFHFEIFYYVWLFLDRKPVEVSLLDQSV